MQDIMVATDKNGGVAFLTVYSPQSHYRIPALRIQAEDVNGDFGPADLVAPGLPAAEIVAGWAITDDRTDAERDAARLFCQQWPDGPQVK